MDRVLRHYAHSAWTPADPLAGIDPEVRRAILLMPSTFRERWKLASWTSQHQRRFAIAEIVAERRLLYELTHQNIKAAVPAALPAPVPAEPGPEPVSPYYRYRLHRHPALSAMLDARSAQDREDYLHIPEARADHDQRLATRRQALLALELGPAKLDVRELELLSGVTPEPVKRATAPRRARTKIVRKSKVQRRDR